MNDGALREIYRRLFHANISPDLNLISWSLLRRACLRAFVSGAAAPSFAVPSFTAHPAYSLPRTIEQAREELARIDEALVAAGVLLYRRQPLEGAYYRAHLSQPPAGLDLMAWAAEERARLQRASAAVRPVGDGLGAWSIETMEGWSPAARLGDLDALMADIDRAVLEELELQELTQRSMVL